MGFFQEGPGYCLQFVRRGSGAEQFARRLAQHFVAAVARVALERLVDEHGIGRLFAVGHGFGNQHNVIEPRNTGFQQH